MTTGKAINRLELGAYYIASIETLWSVIKAQPDTDTSSSLVADIERLIAKKEKTWSEIYSLERLIVPLMPELEVTAFFQRRLARAKSLSLPSTATHEVNWEAAKTEKHPDERLQAKQAAYFVLLDDLNWYHTAQRLNRSQRDSAAQRLWRVGLVILFIVALPWLLIAGLNALSTSSSAAKAALEALKTQLPVFGLYTALSFGLLGALFSRLSSFQSNVADLTYADIGQTFRLRYLMVRFGFGMVGAAILYFLLAGEFVEGSLFPKLEAAGFTSRTLRIWELDFKTMIPNVDFAKLVVWSFIGGFSERFVSSTLEKSETNAAVAENKLDD